MEENHQLISRSSCLMFTWHFQGSFCFCDLQNPVFWEVYTLKLALRV